MSYKIITTADKDWFFVQTDHKQMQSMGASHPVIMRIAVWALTEDGLVVGLSAHPNTVLREGATAGPPRLYWPSEDLIGRYQHINDFTPKELEALKKSYPHAVPSS